jgi:SPP1 family predicted phage head-tail adaptor
MPRNIGHLMVHSIQIQRSVPVKNDHGGWTKAFVTQSTVQGRFWPVRNKDLMVGMQDQARVTHATIFQPGTDVRIDDRLLFDGRQFDVKVRHIQPSINIYRKVLSEEIQIN